VGPGVRDNLFVSYITLQHHHHHHHLHPQPGVEPVSRDAPIIGIGRLSAVLPIIGIGRLLCRYRPIVIYYVLLCIIYYVLLYVL